MCTLQPGVLPVKPMLGQISRSISHGVKQFSCDFVAEYKYDGMRTQVHLADNCVRVFSRKNEDKTGQMPDVVRIVRENLKPHITSTILDAECVAVDPTTGKFRFAPLLAKFCLTDDSLETVFHGVVWLFFVSLHAFRSFQELAKRARSDIGEAEVSVQVCLFVFDMLELNGQELVKKPLAERREAIRWALREAEMSKGVALASSAVIRLQEQSAIEAEQRVSSLLQESLSEQAEGLMLKAMGSQYEPGRRSESWMKVKKDYCPELRESLDLVVIGAWWGNGRKATWLSPFLMACYDVEAEEFQSVCRCMSGFSDEFYKEWTSFFLDTHVLPSKPPYYNTGEQPDFWLRPVSVWEIRGADLSISPVHRACVGHVHASRGGEFACFPLSPLIRMCVVVWRRCRFEISAHDFGPRGQGAGGCDAVKRDCSPLPSSESPCCNVQRPSRFRS